MMVGDRFAHLCVICAVLVLARVPAAYAQDIWQPIGLQGRSITCVALNPAGVLFAGTASDGLHRSSDGGATWTKVFSEGDSIQGIAINAHDDIYVCSPRFTGIRHSDDDGVTWSSPAGFTEPVTTIAVGPLPHVYAAGTQISHSKDNGATWLLDVPYFRFSAYVWSMAISEVPQIFAVPVRDGSFVVRSTDHSNWWDKKVLTPGCTAIAYSPNGTIFVGAAAGVYRSTDYAENYTLVTTGLPGVPVRCFAFTPAGTVYAGTLGAGVYFSVDNGGSWAPMNNGLSVPDVQTLAMDAQGRLIAGTASGVFRSAPVTTGVTQCGTRTAGCTLGQNYPNPCTSSTVLPFTMPHAGRMTLRVYDLRGTLLCTETRTVDAAGLQQQQVNTAALPAGVYRCTLEACGGLQSRLMTVMK
jgi:photosystem II stability/assembly factor-like uncharacterized protein